LLLLVSFQALTGRANGNWAAPIFVAGCVLVIAFLAESGRWRFAVSAVVLNLALGLVVYHWPDITRVVGVELTAKNDPYKRARGWSALADQVAPVLAEHPGAVIVAKDRELLAQVIYRLEPPRYASWNPDGGVADHYQLTTDLNRYRDQPVLFLSRTAQIDDVAGRFDSVTALGEVSVSIHRNFERRLTLYLLTGFRGYP
jgi:hypothetical protein